MRFLTRNGCHLCDEARSLVLAAARRSGIEVLEVDIDDHEELVGEFGLRIPVVLGADGQVLAEGIIEEKSLRRALRD